MNLLPQWRTLRCTTECQTGFTRWGKQNSRRGTKNKPPIESVASSCWQVAHHTRTTHDGNNNAIMININVCCTDSIVPGSVQYEVSRGKLCCSRNEIDQQTVIFPKMLGSCLSNCIIMVIKKDIQAPKVLSFCFGASPNRNTRASFKSWAGWIFWVYLWQ